jgi:hypothetical protein
MASTCPHCGKDNATERCEHWLCAKDDRGILEFLLAAHVSPNYDPELVQKHRAKYMVEIDKYAIVDQDGWFTRTPEAEKMKRRLQKSVIALEATSYPVRK